MSEALSGKSWHCTTIQAFAAALNVQVMELLKGIKALEESLQMEPHQNSTALSCTLMSLQYNFLGLDRRISMLHGILNRVRTELKVFPSTAIGAIEIAPEFNRVSDSLFWCSRYWKLLQVTRQLVGQSMIAR
mgnify:CR=1 FL=1